VKGNGMGEGGVGSVKPSWLAGGSGREDAGGGGGEGEGGGILPLLNMGGGEGE
jgi:hypothetical protein